MLVAACTAPAWLVVSLKPGIPLALPGALAEANGWVRQGFVGWQSAALYSSAQELCSEGCI